MENIKHRILDEISQLRMDIKRYRGLSSDELISIGLMVTNNEIDQWENEIRLCEELLKYLNKLEAENDNT